MIRKATNEQTQNVNRNEVNKTNPQQFNLISLFLTKNRKFRQRTCTT